MPILIIVLLAILVAQVGFWKTLAALLGAVGVVILFVVIVGATLVATALYLVQRSRNRVE